MSYYGWNGKRDSFDVAKSLTATLHSLKNAGVRIDFIAQLNDSGYSFDEIAEYIDRVGK
jgi:3'-phosphoadenosine 5'-phosphosulfate sulfotransferase (PAPS reductase)/FAD synthetase